MYVLSFFQKRGHYSRGDIIYGNTIAYILLIVIEYLEIAEKYNFVLLQGNQINST